MSFTSITLPMILAVPSNVVFRSISTGITVPVFSKNPSSLFETVPKAPTTISMSSTWFKLTSTFLILPFPNPGTLGTANNTRCLLFFVHYN